jgi:SOS-response transcriptional repressor LexA
MIQNEKLRRSKLNKCEVIIMISTRLRVKELLKERHWTTKVLAEKTGMSESYLTHIKNGTRRWNEDALRKLAEAFELTPADILDQNAEQGSVSKPNLVMSEEIKQQMENLNLNLKVAPVVGQIPSQPSVTNNQMLQLATGYKGQFVPVVGLEDETLFCLSIEDNMYAPTFTKGDLLVISPTTRAVSGDLVAIEYGTENPTKTIAQITFSDELIVLESINHKKAPTPLVRGKDQFKIIGKVVYRYQKLG